VSGSLVGVEGVYETREEVNNAVNVAVNEVQTRINAVNTGPRQSPDKVDYDAIAKKSIFGKLGAPVKKEKSLPVANVPLLLIGTFITVGQTPYAIIEDEKKRDQEVFVIGDEIFDAAKLTGIYPDKVEIDRKGNKEILALDLTSGSTSGGTGDRVLVDERELEKALDNLPLLLTQARAVPYFKDGKSIGLRLFAVKRGSLYEKIGLKNGDILKAINGSSLGDITQAVKLFEKLRDERSITLLLERNRKEKEIEYEIE